MKFADTLQRIRSCGTRDMTLVVSTFVVLQSPDVPAASDSTVDMTASDETFAFSPDKVVARVGQLETIDLKSAGGVHGVVSIEFDIETMLVRPDHPVKLAFMPKAPGAYVHCNACIEQAG